jgi:predicted nucleic acid-binding protein
MIYLLDTNAVTDLLREHPKALASLAGLQATDRLVTCSIVKGEIRYGLDRLPEGKRRSELEAKSNRLMASLPCEPVPEGASDHYARIKLNRQRRGLSLDENDLWIAATAFVLGATLVTRDADFGGIDGLMVTDWTK